MSQSPLDSPQAAGLLKNQAKLKSLLQSPDTKALMALLQRGGGDVQQAAKAAMGGDASQLQALLAQLTANPEGARLVEKINETAQRS